MIFNHVLYCKETKMFKTFFRISIKKGLEFKLWHRKLQIQFYPGDLVTHSGDWESCVVSGRHLDNP